MQKRLNKDIAYKSGPAGINLNASSRCNIKLKHLESKVFW